MNDVSPRPLTVAIVGAGGMAAEHVKAFKDIERVTVAGVCSRRRERADAFAAEHGISYVADDIAGLAEATKADLVVVAVPETAILAVMRQVLAKDWSVLMEKPLGVDAREAETIGMLAAEAERMVHVGLNRRCLSSTMAALEDLANDPGRRLVHVQDQQSLETARIIGHPDPVVRNWMYANSIHLVDYLLTFGRGEVIAVDVLEPWRFDAPGVVMAKVSFSSGDIGLYEALWDGPGPWACTVSTPRRRWEMRPLEKAVFQNAGERTLNPVEASVWDGAFKPGFREQAGRVAAALRGLDGLAPIGLEEALRTTRLVRDIYGMDEAGGA